MRVCIYLDYLHLATLVNFHFRTYSRGLSNWSENSDLEWSFKSQWLQNSAALDVIVDGEQMGDEVDNDSYMQSVASHHLYMFPPALKRDIACFPASPSSILSPNVSRTESSGFVKQHEILFSFPYISPILAGK